MAAQDDYFSLLGMPLAFELDLQQLASQYRTAASAVHPDRFVTASQQDRLLAVQRSAELNQAYQTLKSTTGRALYLLGLQQTLDEETTVQDPEFLFQQLEWREELEELAQREDITVIAPLKKRLQVFRATIDSQFAQIWQDSTQRPLAEKLVRRMQFLDKMLYELRQLEERLDD